jgi:hypothetical protein
LRAWLVVLAVGCVIAFVNTTSIIIEDSRDGDALEVWTPVLWEYSSVIVLVTLAPLIGLAIRRVPPQRGGLLRFFLVHAALTAPFSLAHVAGMVAIRKLGHALIGERYDFSHGMLALELLYEWRKDVLAYAIMGAVFWYFGRPRPSQPAGETRIEIRDGGTALFLAPGDIVSVEAAGNYVEFHTAAGPRLVRGTLAAWEKKLVSHGFLRVHRSRLINRAHIRALKPTPAGDIEITLEDGRCLIGSRRYRAALENRLAA